MKKNILILLITVLTPFLSYSQGQVPVNLVVNIVQSNLAILQWEAGTCAQSNYVLSYKDSSLSSWDSIIVLNSGFGVQVQTLTGLNSLTTYNWRVKCDTTWVNGNNFTTTSCFTFNYGVTGVSCFGGSDGAVDLTLGGGFSPYIYSWSSNLYPLFSESTEDIDSLYPGTYYISVTDQNGSGCTEIDSVVVAVLDSHSVDQTISNFTINPVTGYGAWTNTNLQLTNTGCDVNLRPEFLIHHESLAISQGDLDLQWYDPIFAFWKDLAYDINSGGNAYGIWHPTCNNPGPNANIDSTGWSVNEGQIQTVEVRVRFNNNPTNTANYGLYSCIWNTLEVDASGNLIQALSPSDTAELRFSNCNGYTIDSLTINNIICNGNNNGSATVFSVNNGSGSYIYQWSNGDSLASSSNLSAGNYSVIVTDSVSGCQDSTSFTITEAKPYTSNNYRN